jgi:hypothetical protein
MTKDELRASGQPVKYMVGGRSIDALYAWSAQDMALPWQQCTSTSECHQLLHWLKQTLRVYTAKNMG